MTLGIIIYLVIGFSLSFFMLALTSSAGIMGGTAVFKWKNLKEGVNWMLVIAVALFYPLFILYIVGMSISSKIEDSFFKWVKKRKEKNS